MLLEHVKGTTVDTELEAEYTALTEQMDALLNQMSVLLEAPMSAMADRLAGQDAPPQESGNTERMSAPGQINPGENMDEIMNAMEQVMKQMEAAKRGLGMVNKLGDSPSRTTNRSRVMGNMNRIRANLRRIEKMLTQEIDKDPELRSELDYDRRSASGVTEKLDLKSLEKTMDKKSKEGLEDPFSIKKKKYNKNKSK